MRGLTRSEAEQWCASNSISLNDRALPDRRDAETRFRIPQDAGERVAIVKMLVSGFEGEPETLVWFNDWGVWPSGEQMHIFDRFRLSYGEERRLIDAPAHIIKRESFECAVSLAVLGVLFLWDCYLITPRREKLVFFSHDEFGQAWGVPAPS